MKLLLVAVAGFIFSASTAFAEPPTEIEAFHRKVQKYTVDDIFGDKPKSLCICKDSAYYNAVGVLDSFIAGRIFVDCWVLHADDAGHIDTASTCSDWFPLAK